MPAEVFSYKTDPAVCSSEIRFELDEHNIIRNVTFTGGCAGNLLAISKLVKGRPAEEIINLLKGNRCGGKMTSCGDQLAKALELAVRKRADQEG